MEKHWSLHTSDDINGNERRNAGKRDAWLPGQTITTATACHGHPDIKKKFVTMVGDVP